MSFTITPLPAPGLWHVDYAGRITAETRNQALTEFVRQAKGRDVQGIVVDLRRADMEIGIVDAYNFGARLAAEPGLGTCRLVFLELDRHAERSVFLETVARNRGRQARVMTSWDEAVAWLSGKSDIRPSGASVRDRILRPGVPGGSL